MKNRLALAVLFVGIMSGSVTSAAFADESVKLERTAEKYEHRADRQERKAELDVTENKVAGAEKHARKAALDELKAEKDEDLAKGGERQVAVTK